MHYKPTAQILRGLKAVQDDTSALCGENKNDEPQRARRITGINWSGSTWEGTPFRRAVHLIWRTYGTAEQAAEELTFKYRSG